MKKIVVFSEWTNEQDFKELKLNVENQLSNDYSISYLSLIKGSYKPDELPDVKWSKFVSKKDFTLFGKLKTPALIELLNKKSEGALIVAMENNNPFLGKVLKNSSLMSIGIEKETLPKFDLAFTGSDLSGGKLFKQINKYLNKIKL